MPTFVRQERVQNKAGTSKLRPVGFGCYFGERPIPVPYNDMRSGEPRILIMGFEPLDNGTDLVDIPRTAYHPATIDELLADEGFTEDHLVKRLLHGDDHTMWMRTSKGACRTTFEHVSASFQEGPVLTPTLVAAMNMRTAERRLNGLPPVQL